MKYRIIICDDIDTPFLVQRQNEKSFWKRRQYVDKYRHRDDAESYIRRVVETEAKYTVGKVIFEYDQSDLLVNRLKN